MATYNLKLGDQNIPVVDDATDVTIHADADDVRETAARAGVALKNVAAVAPGLIRATITGDRDAVMTRLRDHNVVHHVYRSEHDRGQEFFITDTFHIKFKRGTLASQVDDYLRSERLTVEKDLGDGLLLARVTDQTGHNAIRASNLASSSQLVEYAEPNLVREIQRFSETPAYLPVDSLFGKQWHLHAPKGDGEDLAAGAGIFAPEAWALGLGSRQVVVAIADDGFDLTHPDFQGEGKIAGRLNLTPLGNELTFDDQVMPRPGDYHGTPCAGVALAEGNGTGVVGVAPGCALLAVRFPLAMSDHHFILMFERISRLADIVSCSWGFGPSQNPMSTALRDCLSRLARTGGRRGKGLVICVAAGNNNAPIRDLVNNKPYQFLDQFRQLRSYSGPIDRWIAAHPEVITVSACTSLKHRSAYSSWGKEIGICAPSDNWDDLGRVPTVGRGIVTTDNEGVGPNSDFDAGSRFTASFGGTSSATPTVAGVCALVLSRNPALTAQEVREIVKRTADKDLEIQSATQVNAPGTFQNGVSAWFGHGKVNAARAVREALPEQHLGTVRQTSSAELAFPEASGLSESAIDVVEDGAITELRIEIRVESADAGALRLNLLTPDGRAVAFPNRNDGGCRCEAMNLTYSSADIPALASLSGLPVKGTWRLRVAAAAAPVRGAVKSWSLIATVNRRGATPDQRPGQRSNGVSHGALAPADVPPSHQDLRREGPASHPKDALRHDILLITPEDEYFRFPANKTELEDAAYGEVPFQPTADAPGTRKIRNLAKQGDGSAENPLRGPVFATLPLNPEPTFSSSLTCYLINTRNLEYQNPWTEEEWSQVPIRFERQAFDNRPFKLLVAAPDGVVYLLEKTEGKSLPTVKRAVEDNPEVWSQLRNGTVVGRTLYFDADDNQEVIPLVNITSLVPSVASNGA